MRQTVWVTNPLSLKEEEENETYSKGGVTPWQIQLILTKPPSSSSFVPFYTPLPTRPHLTLNSSQPQQGLATSGGLAAIKTLILEIIVLKKPNT